MEIQLRELIDQIKKEGVEAAQSEAKSILDTARDEAEKIVASAQAEADRILANAKSESECMVKSGEEALRQAGRNLLISFRESVTRELNALLNEGVSKVYSSERFSELIVRTVEEWTKKTDAESPELILNADDLASLEEEILAGLKERMQKGITLKADDHFDGGFRIGTEGGSVYYDYSAEAVVEMLSHYLSPKVTKLLKEA